MASNKHIICPCIQIWGETEILSINYSEVTFEILTTRNTIFSIQPSRKIYLEMIHGIFFSEVDVELSFESIAVWVDFD